MDAATLFDTIASAALRKQHVTETRMFDAQVLKIRGKVFAMLAKGTLVIKLPAERVSAMVAAGEGRPFDPGHGRVMKGWISIPLEQRALWSDLTDEAREFVAAAPSLRAKPRGSRRQTR